MSLLLIPVPTNSDIAEQLLQQTIEEFLLTIKRQAHDKKNERNAQQSKAIDDIVVVPWKTVGWNGPSWDSFRKGGQLILGDNENDVSEDVFEENFQVALDRLLIRRTKKKREKKTENEEDIYIIPIVIRSTVWNQEEDFFHSLKIFEELDEKINKVCKQRASLGLYSEASLNKKGIRLNSTYYVPWMFFRKCCSYEKLPESIFRAPDGLYDGNEQTKEYSRPFLMLGRTVGGHSIEWKGRGRSRLFNDLLFLWTLSQLGSNHPQNIFSQLGKDVRSRFLFQTNSALFDVPLDDSIKSKRLKAILNKGISSTTQDQQLLPNIRKINQTADEFIKEWMLEEERATGEADSITSKPLLQDIEEIPEPIGLPLIKEMMNSNKPAVLPILSIDTISPSPKYKKVNIIPKFVQKILKRDISIGEEKSEVFSTSNRSEEAPLPSKPSADNWQEYTTEKWSILSPPRQTDAFAIKVYTILNEESEDALSKLLDETLNNMQDTINSNREALQTELSSFFTEEEKQENILNKNQENNNPLYKSVLIKLARTMASLKYLQSKLKKIEESENKEERIDIKTQILESREKWLKKEEQLLQKGAEMNSKGAIAVEAGAIAIITLALFMFIPVVGLFISPIGLIVGCIFGLSTYNRRIQDLNDYFREWEIFELTLIEEANELSKAQSKRVDHQVKQLQTLMLMELRQSLVAIEDRFSIELNGFITYVNQESEQLNRKLKLQQTLGEEDGRFSYQPDDNILYKFSKITNEKQQEFYTKLYQSVLQKPIKLKDIPHPATLDDHEHVLGCVLDASKAIYGEEDKEETEEILLNKKISEDIETVFAKAVLYSHDAVNLPTINILANQVKDASVYRSNYSIFGKDLFSNSRFKMNKIINKVFTDSNLLMQNTTEPKGVSSEIFIYTHDEQDSEQGNHISIGFDFPHEVGLLVSVQYMHLLDRENAEENAEEKKQNNNPAEDQDRGDA